MKKSIFVLALLGAMMASAEDSYLYWMVGEDAPSDYAYAKVKDTTSNSYLNLYDEYGSIGPVDSIDAATINDARTHGEAFYASLNGIDTSSSTWIIELFNSQNETIDSSAPMQYQTVFNTGIASPASALTPAMGTSFATPEPNSGVLVLIGCAVLGLRRRRQKSA